MKPRIPASGELTPDTAIDGKDRHKLIDEAVIALLLHWMLDPAVARGKNHFVPPGHPSGLGGRTIYVPANFPLPGQAE